MSRKCDKLESDDFKNEMKNEFELICKALNESKMPRGWCCPRFMGGQGEQWGRGDLEEIRRGTKTKAQTEFWLGWHVGLSLKTIVDL